MNGNNSEAAQSPDNPYRSYLIQASAGSGKTFQLSRRYLKLVAAGSLPYQILTITFTKKAAAEMRHRIVEEAFALSTDEQQQKEFDKEAIAYFEQLPKDSKSAPYPLKAVDVARTILSQTQSLKITTIDATFFEWVKRFSHESILNMSQTTQENMDLWDSVDSIKASASAWSDVFKDLMLGNEADLDQELSASMQLLELGVDQLDTSKAIGKTSELFRHDTFIWQQLRRYGAVLHQYLADKHDQELEARDVIRSIEEPLRHILSVSTRKEELEASLGEAIEANSFNPLQGARILTADGKISKGTFRGKKRESVFAEIEIVEGALGEYLEAKALRRFDLASKGFFLLYCAFLSRREADKGQSGGLEFSDLVKACSTMFSEDNLSGVVWSILHNTHHLLLDEFQDTSLLQWSVFDRLATELLSGEIGRDVLSSVFLVGDVKQSIYAFREAAPEVMELARESLNPMGLSVIPMNKSFRTSQIILDFVNHFFRDRIKDFPDHTTAHIGGNPFVANLGKVWLAGLVEDQGDTSAVEIEAKIVAKKIQEMLSSPKSYPVFDRKSKSLRPITPGDIGILYRNGTHVASYQAELQSLNIPSRRFEERGLFERDEIRDLIAFFRYCIDPTDCVSLLTWLRGSFINLDQEGLSKLLNAVQGLDGSEGLESKFKLVLSTQFEDVWDRVQRLRQKSFTCSPLSFIHALYREFHCFDRVYSAGVLECEIAAGNLVLLYEICSRLENSGVSNLAELLDKLDELAEADEFGSATPATDAVQMMTVHKSKGLEFAAVFVISVGQSPWFRSDPLWAKYRLGETTKLAYIGTAEERPGASEVLTAIVEDQKNLMREEAYRLLYVAFTRASHYLHLSGTAHRNSKESFFEPIEQTLKAMNRHAESSMNLQDFEPVPLLEVAGESSEAYPWLSSEPALDQHQKDRGTRTPKKVVLPPANTKIVSPSASKENKTRADIEMDKNFAIEGFFERISNSLQVQEKELLKKSSLFQDRGEFIHKSLELVVGYFAKNRRWPSASMRQAMYDNTAPTFFSAKYYLQGKEDLIDAIIKEAAACVERNLANEAFLEMFDHADRIYCEQSLVGIAQKRDINHELVRGQVDLLLGLHDGGVLIVDYKTTIIPSVDSSLMREYCETQGYFSQLKSYESILRRHSDADIHYGIWLTELATLIKE